MLRKSIVKSSSKINPVQIYESILFMLLICGFDLNVWKFKMCLKVTLLFYSVFLVITNIYANLACCVGQEMATVWSILEYTATVIATLVLKNQIRSYFDRLMGVDTYLRIGPKYYLRTKNKTLLCTLVLWTIRVVYTIAYIIWYPFYDDFTLFVISQFSLLALDLNRVWRFILFDMMWLRLKMLRRRMEEMSNYSYFCYVDNFKTLKQSRIRFCLDLYRKLADAVDEILPELHASLFISVVCTIPKVIMNAYHILLVIENMRPQSSALPDESVRRLNEAKPSISTSSAIAIAAEEPLSSVGFAALHVTQVMLFILAPCLVVEQFGVEVERIRLLLMHRLFDETDVTTIEEVDLFLRYTKLRPFRCCMWRILPITMMLPLDIINLCTTYVIVLINFTHLYG